MSRVAGLADWHECFEKMEGGEYVKGGAHALMPLKISAFPKCYLEDISNGKMSLFEWIEMAKKLDADGLEMYSGFFTSFEQLVSGAVGRGDRSRRIRHADDVLFAGFHRARSG